MVVLIVCFVYECILLMVFVISAIVEIKHENIRSHIMKEIAPLCIDNTYYSKRKSDLNDHLNKLKEYETQVGDGVMY